jgi:hypothetical protein
MPSLSIHIPLLEPVQQFVSGDRFFFVPDSVPVVSKAIGKLVVRHPDSARDTLADFARVTSAQLCAAITPPS